MLKKSILIFLCCALLFSCKEENQTILRNNDSLAFGASYGLCAGNCVSTYLLQDDKLYESSQNAYASCPDFSSYSLLADSSYQKVKLLTGAIPAALWDEPQGSIGMPDAYDQGGYQVQLTLEGQSKCWFIDTDESNIPDYLHDFTDLIGQSLSALR